MRNRFPGVVFHREEARHRTVGCEELLGSRRQRVAHVAAVGHARAKDVAAAQIVAFLQMADQLAEEADLVADIHVRLRGVADAPAAFAARVLFALRVADGEAVPVGYGVHSEAGRVCRFAVTVQ